MKTQMIPLNQITANDTQNARVANRADGIEDLAASILAHGLIQSLRVSPAGKKGFTVVAGNRRLAALQLLAERGDIPAAHEVPCIVAKSDGAEAFELSTAENVLRLPMTVVDEFKAFARMIDEGKGKEEVAQRFGVPVRRVEQRMKLAALHPDVIEALEEGTITLEGAQAFTVQPDKERQAEYLHGQQYSYMLQPHNIRSHMTDAHLRSDSALAKLLTEEAYVAAGGAIMEDLFGDERYWTSADVIRQLTEAHWKEQTDAWLAEGWAFVSPVAEYGTAIYSMRSLYAQAEQPSDEDQARLDAIEAELEPLYEVEESDDEAAEAAIQARIDALEEEAQTIKGRYGYAFTAEQKAGSGVVYAEDGSHVRFGVVDPSKATPPGAEQKAGAAAAEEKDDGDPTAISATMATALTVTMTHALQAKVAADPDMALRILLATLHTRMRVSGHRPPVHVSGSYSVYDHQNKPEQGASFPEALAWAQARSHEELLAYLAELVGECIDVRDTNQDRPSQASIDALVAFVNPDVTPIFEPEAYFAGVKKPVILAAYKEMTGGKTLRADSKKGELVKAAADAAAETGWLPVQLRTAAYSGPAGTEGESGEDTGAQAA